jgi:DNA-cytosine methyltransferase
MTQELVRSPSRGELALAGKARLLNLLPSPWKQVLLLEDNSARAQRRRTAGIRTAVSRDVVLRLHRITPNDIVVVGEKAYSPGSLGKAAEGRTKINLALDLLDSVRVRSKETLIVTGTRYGGSRIFTSELLRRGFHWAVELPRNAIVVTKDHLRGVLARELLESAVWKPHKLVSPSSETRIPYSIAHLAYASGVDGTPTRLFAAQVGAIDGVHPGTIIGLSSAVNAPLDCLLQAVSWARWIRPLVRLEERRLLKPTQQQPPTPSSTGRPTVLTLRSNIKLAREHDESAQWNGAGIDGSVVDARKRILCNESSTLNVVELFAGAGGMGLGFLLSSQKKAEYRLCFSGEVHPIYAATLKSNYSSFARAHKSKRNSVPHDIIPIDLHGTKALAAVEASTRTYGDTHVIIGGPPCQGFSNANRNSWHGANPHNELVDVFLNYVRRLKPRIFLMENVQGIVWTPKKNGSNGHVTVVNSIAQRMERAGYLVFPKLLDAVWYGVPQYRSRFFLLGIHRDLGYRASDFGEWGPYPLPTHGPGASNAYSTVRDALRDLPRIGNGHAADEIPYADPEAADFARNPYLRFIRAGAEKGAISDHVTSRHAEYVLDRYRQIPAGGNWEDIADALTNYTNVQRTHSNIYRRLSWQLPSITIGHYRKSMLVHPSQNRGLSLREAARLQSFPDWFRFFGTVDGSPGGLMHKQQQLANAVCPLITKSIAEFLLEL